MEGNKLPKLVLYSYGTADLTFTMMMMLSVTYYAYFLTDVAMISAAAMGTILLIARIGDAVSVPLTGGTIQKFQLKWGRFRSWLFIAPVTTTIFYILIFTNFDMSPTAKGVFFGTCYVIAHFSINFAYNAHLGLISVLSHTPEDRMALSLKKSQFGTLGGIGFSLIVVNLLTFFSKASEARGFLIVVIIFSLLQIAGYWNLSFQSKNYDKYEPEEKSSREDGITVGGMIKQIFRNGQLVLLLSSDCVKNSALYAVLGLSTYYFKYIAGNMALMSVCLLVTSISMFLGALVAQPVVNFLKKKPSYLVSCVISGLGYFLILFLGYSSTGFIVLSGLASAGAVLSLAIGPAMYMDAAEYGFYKTGKDYSAFIMSMSILPIKIGIAVGGGVIGYGLAAIGYSPTAEMTPEMVSGIMKLVSLIPAAFCVIPLFIMMFYKLTDTKVAEFMEVNTKKRAGAQEEAYNK